MFWIHKLVISLFPPSNLPQAPDDQQESNPCRNLSPDNNPDNELCQDVHLDSTIVLLSMTTFESVIVAFAMEHVVFQEDKLTDGMIHMGEL